MWKTSENEMKYSTLYCFILLCVMYPRITPSPKTLCSSSSTTKKWLVMEQGLYSLKPIYLNILFSLVFEIWMWCMTLKQHYVTITLKWQLQNHFDVIGGQGHSANWIICYRKRFCGLPSDVLQLLRFNSLWFMPWKHGWRLYMFTPLS